MVGKHLTNYPSANQGYAFPGEKRIGKHIGKTDRTARASLARLLHRGFLDRKLGGPARSARWSFCIDHRRIFGPEATAHDRKYSSGQDRKKSSAKPLELEPLEQEPPPNPPSEPAEASQDDRVVDGEILGATISFDELWHAVQHSRGPSGPALSAWRKLDAADRYAIGNLLGPNGIDCDGMWLCTWITERRWQRQPLRQRAKSAGFHVPTGEVALKPYSIEWCAERDRLRAVGDRQSLRLMEFWAAQGKPWSVAR
jgi:hypothetical protein